MKEIGSKTGLVLEGGGLRSIYSAAVLDVLMEQGIETDEVIGVSAGALFGVNYLSKQMGRVLRYNKRFNRDKDYMGLRPLLREGNVMNTKYAYHDVPFDLDPFDNEAFRKSGKPFFAVVTDVPTGKPEYIRIYDVFLQMDILRASGSMPFVSREVNILGKRYLDGGIADSIPFSYMLSERGCDKVVVILTRDKSYHKKPMSKLPLKLYEKKRPALAEALRNRHLMYERELMELEELEKAGKAFIIRPQQPITIGRLEKDPEKIQGVYDMGIRDMEDYLPKLREFLA